MRISAIVLLFAALVNLASGLPVGSGEKPPIIHFPPPPPAVSFAVGARQIRRSFPPKDDLNQPLFVKRGLEFSESKP